MGDGVIEHFAQGIPAFEDEHEFVLIPYDAESPYLFLQSCQTPDLAFLMTSPYLFFKDYEFEIDDATEKKLGLEKPEDVAVYVLLTIPGGSIKDMTANLMAPVIRLTPLTPEELLVLVEKLADIHAGLYGYTRTLTEDDLATFLEIELSRVGADTLVTPREVIRDFIEMLDIMLQTPGLTVAGLLGSGTFAHAVAGADACDASDDDAAYAEFTI